MSVSNRFTGEVMNCRLCDKQERSQPGVESGWRCIEYQGQAYYVCPAHFPHDGASREAFRQAYIRVLKQILETTP